MLRITRTSIAASILSVVLIACNPGAEPARAYPPRHHDLPRKAAVPASLSYDTTSRESRYIIERLDSFYTQQQRAGFNGSVLIGYKGNVIYERYYGYANREGLQRLSPNSSSQLASTSKTFTSAAILYLYENNYLDINDPVSKYLKGFPYAGVTIKMLLDHRSGLPDYLKFTSRYKKNTRIPITSDDVLDIMIKYRPAAESKPNTRFKYCNTNFVMLACIIEEVSEMPFAHFMKTYIFDPLGMKNTFVYNPDHGLPSNAAISYKASWVREPDMFADGVNGDKGIYSTVRDMYRWDQSLYNNDILSNETMELAYGPCSFEKPGVKNYGLGWRMLCYPNGNKIVYHNGWWHGNNTVFYRFIQENLTIIVLGNKFNQSIYRQAPVVYSIVKGKPVGSGFDDEE
ncbi:MAG: beta-lactamase family protein [Flavipsychrobacter sp.]|nr:beta-lactamase family protein [Flavipsychrobacter sp.]